MPTSSNPFLGNENPYLNATIDKAQGDLSRNFNLTAQPAYNAAMVNSGSFGNAGVQQMNENALRNLQDSMGNISTQMRGADYNNQAQLYMQQQAADTASNQWGKQFDASQAQQQVQNSQWGNQFNATQNQLAAQNSQWGDQFNATQAQLGTQNNQWQQQFANANEQWNQGFNRQTYNDAYSQNQQNLQTGIGLLGTLNGYQQQDLTNGTNVQNTPLNYWNQFSQGANSLGQGYGSTTGTTGSSSNPALAAIGGAQLGRQAAGWWGNSAGTDYMPTANQGYNGGSSSDGLSGLVNLNGGWGTMK